MSAGERLPDAAPTGSAAAASSTAGFGRMLARGAMFSSLSTALLRLGQFVVSVVIARLISPRNKPSGSWRFRPARKNGEPVAVWVDIELSFTLR